MSPGGNARSGNEEIAGEVKGRLRSAMTNSGSAVARNGIRHMTGRAKPICYL